MFNLLKELKKYVPFDDDEKNKLKMFIRFLTNSKNPFNRKDWSGHVTAGGFVADDKGKILLNHHKKSDQWIQFGGHYEETDADCFLAAKREVFEESGITDFVYMPNQIFDVDVQLIPENENEKQHIHYDVNFLFITDKSDFSSSEESIDVEWVSATQAKKLINRNDKSMHRMIEKYKLFLKEYKQNKKQK